MIMEYINAHHTEFWFAIGFILLAIEIVTGLTTGIFLFGGLGALVTGLLMSVGAIPETWIAGISSLGICSGMVTALLWKPLSKLQGGRESGKDNSSDFVGHAFPLEQDISTINPGSTKYSGVTWKVFIDKAAGVTDIQAGQHVVVTSVEVGKFYVKPA